MNILVAIGKWFVGTKFGRWIIGLGAVLLALALAIGAAFLKGHSKGKAEQADADKTKDAQSLAEAAQNAVQRVNDAQEIENAIAKQPDAGTQQVGTALPGTSAGELREHWMRPDAAPSSNPTADKS